MSSVAFYAQCAGREDLIRFFSAIVRGKELEVQNMIRQDKSLANATDPEWKKEYISALTMAVIAGKREMVALLKDNGANVDGDPRAKESPILKAYIAVNFGMVKYLIKLGANTNRLNSIITERNKCPNTSGPTLESLMEEIRNESIEGKE